MGGDLRGHRTPDQLVNLSTHPACSARICRCLALSGDVSTIEIKVDSLVFTANPNERKEEYANYDLTSEKSEFVMMENANRVGD
jgi:hypothetical protein